MDKQENNNEFITPSGTPEPVDELLNQENNVDEFLTPAGSPVPQEVHEQEIHEDADPYTTPARRRAPLTSPPQLIRQQRSNVPPRTPDSPTSPITPNIRRLLFAPRVPTASPHRKAMRGRDLRACSYEYYGLKIPNFKRDSDEDDPSDNIQTPKRRRLIKG